MDPRFVSASAKSLDNLSLAAVHGAPFDPADFVQDGCKGVHYEFAYDPTRPKSALRIVTTLGETKELILDGILAARLGFMAMELLEGKELSTDSPAARKVPPFTFGLRHKWNFFKELMPGTLIRILVAYASMLLDFVLGAKPPKDVTLVHDAKSIFR